MTDSHRRIDREEFAAIAPEVHAALIALGKAVTASGLEKQLTELVKLRASQLNGCAFCLQYHLNLARDAGVTPEKLDLVATWREAGVHTPREMAALAWTEALTLAPADGASDATWAALLEQFTRSEAIFLTVAIGTINQWNRIAGPLRFTPPLRKATRASAA